MAGGVTSAERAADRAARTALPDPRDNLRARHNCRKWWTHKRVTHIAVRNANHVVAYVRPFGNSVFFNRLARHPDHRPGNVSTAECPATGHETVKVHVNGVGL
jgi:hypothetical protein